VETVNLVREKKMRKIRNHEAVK